jgi:C-terminal processing protease CtpA/Prc
VVFQNEAGSSQLTRTVRLVSESVASADRYPFAEDALARVPSEVAYFRLRRMEGDERYIDSLAAWIQGQRDARGAIIDIRDNGGGSRLPLLTLLPHVLSADASPVVVTAGKLKLPAECLMTACPAPEEGYLADRFMRPLHGFVEGTSERAALDLWLPTFKPEWTPPEGGFSDWHYLVISPDADPVFERKPVIVLMNNANFSASDIFLSGFKGRENVLLMGTSSSGGSARRVEHVLPNSGLAVSLATLASFQARYSTLYDGVGIRPDLEVASEPGFFVNASDDVLDQAISLIRSFGGNWF